MRYQARKVRGTGVRKGIDKRERREAERVNANNDYVNKDTNDTNETA